MEKQKKQGMVNLHLFDGAASADGTGPAQTGGKDGVTADAGQNKRTEQTDLSHIRYGKQEEPKSQAAVIETEKEAKPQTASTSGQERKRAFEQLIKSEYKDLFDERVQKIIDNRFKETKTLQEQAEKIKPVLELLSGKYGVPADALDKLVDAIEEDDSYYEKEALDKGLTVQQLKEIKRVERENEMLRKAMTERERRENADRIYADWMQQAETVKTIYPSFQFETECENPGFIKLLQNGIDVRTAYEVVHRDEVIAGAMQFTAQQVQKKTVDNIRARGLRPAENGMSSQSPIVTKNDPSKFTKKDRDEIERRVRRGERIIL